MQENEKYSNLLFNARDEDVKKAINSLNEENQRLQLENEVLRKELEREQILHRNLYNEWKELKSGPTVKKTGSIKIKRFIRRKSSFYSLFTLAIFLSALIIFWAFFNNTNTFSSQKPSPGLVDTTSADTISKRKAQALDQKSSLVKNNRQKMP